MTSNTITGSATGILVQDFANGVTVASNSFSGNTVGVNNTDGSTLNASVNWWGTTDAAVVFAGTSGLVDFTPFLDSGTDTDLGTAGFQGDLSIMNVTLRGEQALIQDRIARDNQSMFIGDSVDSIKAGAVTVGEKVNELLDTAAEFSGDLSRSATELPGRISAGADRVEDFFARKLRDLTGRPTN